MDKRGITRLYYRVSNAVKIGLWAFKNPDSLKEGNFKMISDLFGLIMKASAEDRPVMTHVADVYLAEEQIVSIWAGVGMGVKSNKNIDNETLN
jgi:hypothetical protein